MTKSRVTGPMDETEDAHNQIKLYNNQTECHVYILCNGGTAGDNAEIEFNLNPAALTWKSQSIRQQFRPAK